jgi:hypothetical protein
MQTAVESAIDTLFTSLDSSARTECIFRLLPLVADNQRDKLRDRIEQLRGTEPEAAPSKRQRTGTGELSSSGAPRYDQHTPGPCIAGDGPRDRHGGASFAAALSEFKEGDWLCIGCHSHNFRKQSAPRSPAAMRSPVNEPLMNEPLMSLPELSRRSRCKECCGGGIMRAAYSGRSAAWPLLDPVVCFKCSNPRFPHMMPGGMPGASTTPLAIPFPVRTHPQLQCH